MIETPNDNETDPNSASVIFLGNETELGFAKTGVGIRDWRPERCVGQIRLTPQTVDLGLPDLSVDEAGAVGVKQLIIGIANIGGGIPESWLPTLEAAAKAGIHIVSGLHESLASVPSLPRAAKMGGANLIDIRVPPANIPIASGAKRPGKRILTVGTDCASGKKYTALAIERELKARHIKSTFRATGQTGIMIAGSGIPIDSVVCDFTAGAAEMISPSASADHWDVIEGQGALSHPAYAGVSLGLLHGSQPDAFVVCHEAERTVIHGWPDYPLPSLEDCIAMTINMGRRTNPDIRCVGLSINTSKLRPDEVDRYLKSLQDQLGLPAVDPMRTGVAAIIDHMLAN